MSSCLSFRILQAVHFSHVANTSQEVLMFSLQCSANVFLATQALSKLVLFSFLLQSVSNPAGRMNMATMRVFECITVIITAATASSNGTDWQQQMKEQFSAETMDLYRDFLTHFQHQEMYPTQTAINSTIFPENRLYARTKAVELLHEYLVSATRELNADKLLEDPDYRDVECLGTFSGSNAVTESGESELTVMTRAVRDSIRDLSIEDLYKPDMMSHYAEIVPITESMMEGLKVWGPGHRGVVAKRNISAYTAIGMVIGPLFVCRLSCCMLSCADYDEI